MDIKMYSPEKTNLVTENQELKELILKLNQDKTMYEKKVQRRNGEIMRLKQQLKEAEESSHKPFYKSTIEVQQQNNSQEIQQRLDVIEALIIKNRNLLGNDMELKPLQILEKIIHQCQTQTVEISTLNQKNTLLSIQFDSLSKEQYSKQKEQPDVNQRKKFENEISKLQEQIKIDTNYYNKRINQLEESFFQQRNQLQNQLQQTFEKVQVQDVKISFLISKIQFYEKAISEIHGGIFEIKDQVLAQYMSLRQKFKDLKEPNYNYETVNNQLQYLKLLLEKYEKEFKDIDEMTSNIEKLNNVRPKATIK